MTLLSWLSNGWIIEHRSSPREIADLFSVVDRDLKDCRTTGLSSDWRFSIAYNAALQAATAALAAAGYRASRDAHHFRIIQSLTHTIQADSAIVIRFDFFRKKRNIGGYERAGTISDIESEEMIQLAFLLRDLVFTWLTEHHPDLVAL